MSEGILFMEVSIFVAIMGVIYLLENISFELKRHNNREEKKK